MSKAPPLTCRVCSVSLLSPRTPTDPHRDICFWCERKELRAMVRDLAWALDRFVRYYDQSGIGDCTEEDEDNPPVGFDGDEVYNVRHGRETLAKVPPDLRAPAKAAEDGRKEDNPHG